MSPITHFLIGWVLATNGTDHQQQQTRRERGIITIAGVLPDVDGLGVIVDYVLQDKDLTLWSKYHHVLTHNLSFGLIVTLFSFWLLGWQWRPALLVLGSIHLHLLGDLVGSRSPDGYQWPIPYLYPFSSDWEWAWQGQWALNAWPNFVVTAIVLGITFHLAWRRGYSPVEMISTAADARLVATLRHRF